MFPDTITIYRHKIVNTHDEYERQIVEGVYWMGRSSLQGSGRGYDEKITTSVVSSPENAHTFGTKWDAQVGDYIVKGVSRAISSITELPEAIKVAAVDVNVCGSDVDNIVISGA